ncbi:tetratricopeptide repeat protein [Thalassomonas sp. M1454]|uniref:tetratricopeptide repeat protein n=1 Tax=Thalassomonas sp. M1454 TaxID=2594477 RepID=UPI0011801C25|nr:tetratricopeptide repeat protein [Thalassomonas sp. M1454]TRX55644.1 tetratricopeptide repeat protein [Thalassomonas sp. M1454]
MPESKDKNLDTHNKANNKKATIRVPPQFHKGFALGNIVVEPDLGVIIRDNERYHLAPKAMEILLFLASADCETVTRDQILEFGWGDLNASRTNITHIISEIRHALDDHKECPTYIQTIPRKGYRMMQPTAAKPSKGFFDFQQDPEVFETKHPRWHLSIAILKSSRLFKASVGYLVFSWVLLQVLAIVLPIFNAPSWGIKFSTLVLMIGFPVVLGLQWIKELKIKREKVKSKKQKKLFYYQQLSIDSVFVLLIIGCIYYLSTHLITFIENDSEQVVLQKVEIPSVNVVANSIAVLPFSVQGDNSSPSYLIEGLQEELISFLTHKPDIKVASLRATKALKENSNIDEIQQRLGVNFILEGSAKIIAGKIDITASLIDTTTGFQVWDAEFTGSPSQALKLFEEISRKSLSALNLLIPDLRTSNNNGKAPTTSFEAYDAYLHGKSEYRQSKSIQSLKKAETLYLKALYLDPKFTLASGALCTTYMDLYLLTNDVEQYQKGLQVCELTASYKDVGIEGYIALGQLYLTNGRYQKAKANLEKAIVMDPDNPIPLQLMANVYIKLEQVELAESLLLKAIEIEPAYWRNYYQYGIYFHLIGQYEKAIPLFQKVNLLNDNIAASYNALGASYYLIMDWDNAIIAWSKSLAIEPSALTYSNLGTSLFFTRQFDNAVEMYQNAVKMTPEDNIVWGNLGDALKFSASYSYEDALNAYNQALILANKQEQINPNDISLKAQISRYYSELNQCDSANSYKKSSLAIQSQDPYLYYDLAIVDLNCKQLSQADIMLENAIKYGYEKELLLVDPQFLVYKEQLNQL